MSKTLMEKVVNIMKHGGDLGSVIVDEKSLQKVISGQLIPSINKVAMGILKWSYTESNYTFPDVFSAYADLDAGFTLLLQEYLQECIRYRKSFKTIITEAKKVSDLQKEKEKTASKVTTTSNKLDAAKKTVKKNENNERAKVHVKSLEADLFQARANNAGMEELLRNTIADFECYKSSMLKQSLVTHCQSLQDLLQKGTELCQVKMEIAEAMPDEPAMMPDPANDNNRKVETIFNKYNLQLPPRDPTLERNLPAQQFKTLPPPLGYRPQNQPRINKQTSMPAQAPAGRYPKPPGGLPEIESDEGEDDDYMIPNEDAAPRPTVKTTPPVLPRPRIDAEEEDYVIPTLSPKSPMGNKPRSPFFPGDEVTEYFQVVSDDDNKNTSSAPQKTSNPIWLQNDRNAPEPVSEPMYTLPPDEDEDSNQIYSNLTEEQFEEHNRKPVTVPLKPLPYVKLEKPAFYPKPALRPTIKAPSRNRQDSASRDEECASRDDSIYSIVDEEDSAPNKTGVSPPTPSQRHTFLSLDSPGHDRQTEHSYYCPDKQDSFDSAGETDISNIYYNVDVCDNEMSDSDPSLCGNVLGLDQTALITDSVKPSPPVAIKPVVLSRKPLLPVRGKVK